MKTNRGKKWKRKSSNDNRDGIKDSTKENTGNKKQPEEIGGFL